MERRSHTERGTLVWHTDKSYMAYPSLATFCVHHRLLIMAETPSRIVSRRTTTSTNIANQIGAGERIQGNVTREKAGEKPATPEQLAAAPPVEHPLVRTHPVTARKSLYLGAHTSHSGYGTGGRRDITASLERHATHRSTCTYKWQTDDG